MSKVFPQALLWSLSAGLALACGPGPAPKNVKVTVVVILAGEGKGEVEDSLRQIAREVQKKRPELKSFRLESTTCESLPVEKTTAFPLVDRQTAEITIKHGADEQNRVKLAVKPPGQGEFVYRTVCGKFLPIVTQHKTERGECLILAIRVQPCNGGH